MMILPRKGSVICFTLLVFSIISVSNAHWVNQNVDEFTRAIKLEDEYKISFNFRNTGGDSHYFAVDSSSQLTLSGKGLKIYFPVNGSLMRFDKPNVEIGVTYFVELMQEKVGDEYHFSIKFDHSTVYTTVNNATRNDTVNWKWTSSSGRGLFSNISFFYKGYNCSDVNPCSQNARCLRDKNGSFKCTCRHGYQGNGYECFEMCADYNPCNPNANCRKRNGYYECTCRRGFRGNGYECYDVNECDKNPCHKFASCKNTRGSYQCTCHKGYMGNGYHCQEMWLPNSRCGGAYLLPSGMEAQCNPKGNTPCCSAHGWCGNSPKHCECPTCVDYRQECLYNDMDITTETLREEHGKSWKDCESLCKGEEECMAWVWRTETFHHESSRKMCTLKRGKENKDMDMDMYEYKEMRLGLISGWKHCPDDQQRSYMGSMPRNESQPRLTTFSYRGSCKGNMCTRGTTGSLIEKGDSLRSDNKKYTAKMQHDGNFVIYCNDRGYNKAIWSSRTDGTHVFDGMMFQKDGNLVLYTNFGEHKEAVWSSGTYHTEANHLVMQDNGNLAMYGFYEDRIYWESKSYGMC